MSDPLSFSVDRENSLHDFPEFLGVEREEIDFARITDEQLDQYVGDGVTVVTNSVAGQMSEGNFMLIDCHNRNPNPSPQNHSRLQLQLALP